MVKKGSISKICIGGAALNQTPLDWTGNRERIIEVLREARKQAVQMLCLPELCLSGYGCEDMFLSSSVAERSMSLLEELLPHTKDLVVSFGLPVFFKNALFNCAALVVNGRLCGFAAKQNLAGDGVHYEPRWFKAWSAGVLSEYRQAGIRAPIGDLYFNISGVKLGFEICEDAWSAKRTGAALNAKGIDIIFNPSASHFAFGKQEVRERFVVEGARAFGVSYVYSNLLGCESGRLIYDGGVLIASNGKLVARANRFSFADFQLSKAYVDLTQTRMSQAKLASFQPEMLAQDKSEINVEFDYRSQRLAPKSAPSVDSWERSKHIKSEEFARAVALGLFDYLRKSKSRGFVVSLSGGADSSAVSCLVALMLHLALKELGADSLRKKFSYWKDLDFKADAKELLKQFLSCVYQSTQHSSTRTRKAAKELSRNLNALFVELDLESIHQGYIKVIEQALGCKLSWDKADLALQNIQARTRAPSAWLIANLKGAILLSTGNRSEAAVGYASMDGDTAGGLAPLAGIDKAFLREWLLWMEREGPAEFGALPILKLVNAQAPTAELRPSTQQQTDEDDLMPYRVLELLERLAVRDKKNPIESFDSLERELAEEYSFDQLSEWVQKFFKLWALSQWKREKLPPGFHLDDFNLDPKTWCRFPILSGNFEAELRDLRIYLKRKQGGLRVLKGNKNTRRRS